MGKKVLVIGSSGREHAICWKLAQSDQVETIYNSPGSCAIVKVPKTTIVPLDFKYVGKAVVKFCRNHEIHLVVIDSQEYLADGVADELYNANIDCFGPRKQEAQIETDKAWAKAFMDKYGIPQPRWRSFTEAKAAKAFIRNADFPALVVKANGVTSGKGVIIAKDAHEACWAVDQMLVEKKFGRAGETIVIEEYLEGEEISVLAFTDGKTALAMLPVQEYTRLKDGDHGPITEGMGAFCPCPPTIKNQGLYIQENVLNRTVTGLFQDNFIFCGVIAANVIISRNGIRVLEFSCRMGDPETQVVLPLLQSDLFTIMMSCCKGTLAEQTILWKTNTYAVGVVLASHGYPDIETQGHTITGVENITKLSNILVFHNGTSETKGSWVTNGGRILTTVALGSDLAKTACNATQACSTVHFFGAQYRRDIGFRAILRQMIKTGVVSYKKSGTSIDVGDNWMHQVKAMNQNHSNMLNQIPGFASCFDLHPLRYKDPLVVSATQGVGAKIEIANAFGAHKNLGIDLVAMCVNELLSRGADPLFFLHYYAVDKMSLSITKEVITGIIEGCKLAGCAYVGSETTEASESDLSDRFDFAGFAVGVVEREHLIPKFNHLNVDDVVIGLQSSGIHCNGFNLVRSTVQLADVEYSDAAPFSPTGLSYGEEFLSPTKIYSSSILPLISSGYVKAFSHITEGGLLENLYPMLRSDLWIEMDLKGAHILPVFGWLAALGEINQHDMLHTFNCGIGAAIIVAPKDVKATLEAITDCKAFVVGKVKKRSVVDHHQVVVKNFDDAMLVQMRAFVPQIISKFHVTKKKVAVLISGSGTNLQALIDATNDPIQHIGAEIVLVISNRSNVAGLQRAASANITTHVVKHNDYDSRENFDMAIHRLLINAEVDIICLAGFMQALSSQFINKWRGNIINIHPSLLPSFKDVNAQKQALNAGVKLTGCTVHFVEPDMDYGPIIMQETVPVFPNDTESTLIKRIKTQAEHKIYPQALKMLATNMIYLGSDGKMVYNS